MTLKDQLDTDLLEVEADEDTEEGKFLMFSLGNKEYGIEIRNVTEIIGIPNITELSGVPGYVKGIINLRGRVIPVIDVRLRCNLEERAYDERTCIVVVNVKGIAVGLIVDSVSEVMDIPAENIEPLPEVHRRDGSRYIQGLGKIGGDVKFLLDIGSLLGDIDPEWIVETGQPVS